MGEMLSSRRSRSARTAMILHQWLVVYIHVFVPHARFMLSNAMFCSNGRMVLTLGPFSDL